MQNTLLAEKSINILWLNTGRLEYSNTVGICGLKLNLWKIECTWTHFSCYSSCL